MQGCGALPARPQALKVHCLLLSGFRSRISLGLQQQSFTPSQRASPKHAVCQLALEFDSMAVDDRGGNLAWRRTGGWIGELLSEVPSGHCLRSTWSNGPASWFASSA